MTAFDSEIAARPGTRRRFSTGQTRVGVAGLAGATPVIAFHGDSSWGAYQMISGSWFTGPGQAVVPSGFLASTRTHVGDVIPLTDNGHTASVRIVGEAFDLRDGGMEVLTDSASLAGLSAYILPWSVEYHVDLTPGTDARSYAMSLNAARVSTRAFAHPNSGSGPNSTVLAMDTLTAMLTLMLTTVAGLGVLNTVVLDTRERVHDLGVFKALGMTPKQTVGMVLTSVTAVGLSAGAVAVPIGVALHNMVLPAMGRAAGTRIPSADTAVYSLPLLALLVLGGAAIAVAGAMPPAGWAAKTRTATALRTE